MFFLFIGTKAILRHQILIRVIGPHFLMTNDGTIITIDNEHACPIDDYAKDGGPGVV